MPHQEPPDSADSPTLAGADLKIKDRIGPYRVLEKLGEGGMGEVYLVEQSKPVRRQAALKVIKQGIDTREVVARFESERQALAMMDHPSIAKVFDAGVSPGGRPYFVMEYVPGIPITTHCDRERLGLEDRLELFRRVCEAVQHAHHKAIIHRDLKPTNILVSFQDGQALPKIIDFGVAKALAHPLTEKTLHTAHGQLIGTPEYMSPEQAEMSGNIDTRTDVYALGVLLYELVSGVLPFSIDDIRRLSFDEIRRRIREEEPAPPSTRLRTGAVDTENLARRRGTEPATLIRRLKGDLDWIVLKAMEKDRTRRYNSPTELASDIRRHLNNEPVSAGPPSLLYRSRKFIRRHRSAVAVASIFFLFVLTVAVLMTINADRLARERDRAEQEARTALAVAGFLTDLFQVADPKVSVGENPSARELLDRGADRIGKKLAGEPLVRAQLQRTMARAYEHLGLYGQAEPLYQDALAEQRRLLGANHYETLQTLGDLGALFWRQGRFEEAEPLLTQSYQEKARLLGEEAEATINSLNNLANLFYSTGQYPKAEELYGRGLEIRTRVLGPDHPDTLGVANNLSAVYFQLGRLDEAETLTTRILESRKKVQGEDHPDTLGAANNLADNYWRQERFEEAEDLYLDTLERRRRVLGDDHPDTLTTLNNLAGLFFGLSQLDQAEKLYLKAYEGRKRVLGERHPETLVSAYNLGHFYLNQGRHSESERYMQAAVEGWEGRVALGHPRYQSALNGLATLHYFRKDFRRSEEVFLKLLESWRQVSDQHPSINTTLYNLACVASLQGRQDRALNYLQEAVDRGLVSGEVFTDPDLAGLRREPEFQALAVRVREGLKMENPAAQ